jgi:hypothetical protein
LRRVRWQLELVFKVFKSEGKIDETRSTQPYRVICELHAKLLAMVAQLARELYRRCGIVRRRTTPSTLDRLIACEPECEQYRIAA